MRRVLLRGVFVVALVALAGGGHWALTCPCGTTPGFALRGQLHEGPVRDWSIANDVELCQIQITVGIRPHSVNLKCITDPATLDEAWKAGITKLQDPDVQARQAPGSTTQPPDL